jgi:VIT1/CCC1 family predicted Fe2+/Mn2+ transporter
VRIRSSTARRYRRYLARELDNVSLYRGLAGSATGEHREILLELAAAEERHAQYWRARLGELGVVVPRADNHRPRLSSRWTSWLGRRLGVRRVVPLLERVEAGERTRYDAEPAAKAMAADETVHAELVASLSPAWRTRASSSFRATVFGVNDGLVSNVSLVMGMAGGNATTEVVLLAGVAGLVAGAASMAAGEYISVRSQRELLEARPAPGLDTVGLGSPLGAAAFSFGAFAVGAAVPLMPLLVSEGTAAVVAAALFAGLALFLVGATISIVTNRGAVRSGLRQLAVGALAAAGTYLVGLLVGRSIT